MVLSVHKIVVSSNFIGFLHQPDLCLIWNYGHRLVRIAVGAFCCVTWTVTLPLLLMPIWLLN